MKKTTLLSSATILATALSSVSALAYTDEVMDPAQSNDSAVNVSQVDYTCQNNKQVSVTYGFNEQGLPTFAQANLNGKNRYLPINLGRSDEVDTVFGDEENFSIMSSALNQSNYDKSSINIQDANSEIVYKGCEATSASQAQAQPQPEAQPEAQG